MKQNDYLTLSEDGKVLIECDVHYIGEIVIPNSVTVIGEEAFFGCSGLQSIVIPNSVTQIRDRAFSGCDNLIWIEIPNSVKRIGECAFDGCTKLI